MKLAEAVARFLEAQGVKHVFGVNGGANLHLIHGICDATQIKFIPTTHECNAGFAADSYARLTGLGVAMATSGPGATNLITAIAASYYDSVPVFYITGNVATFRFGSQFGVRQYGFQETPIVQMVNGITKHAQQLRWEDVDSKRLPDILENLVYIAQEPRKGPVLLDIPDDIQRADY
jgi:acetolactate synthase I/II/III large subunit